MRRIIFAALFFLTVPMSAQAADAPTPPAGALEGVSPEMMQSAMQKAQSVQACLMKQQGAMDTLRAKSDEMNRTLDALCAEGKEDEAREAALRYGKEMNHLPVVKALRKCGQAIEGGSPIPLNFMPEKPKDGAKPVHVCDGRPPQ